MNWLAFAWHYVFGWAGVDMLIGFACVAIAVLEPPIVAALIPDLRKWAIAGAVVAFTCMGLIGYGYNNGITETKRQWDAALARETAAGEKARSDAVATVGPVPSDRGMFRGDPDNRDSGKQPTESHGPVRWMGAHHLFGR